MDFKLSEKEWKIAEEFMREHSLYSGAIGGQFTVSFIMTSLGDIAVISDSRSGKEKTLTDFSEF